MEEIEISIIEVPTFFDFWTENSIDMLYYHISKECNKAFHYYLVNEIDFKQN